MSGAAAAPEIVVAGPDDAETLARLNRSVQALHAEREPDVFHGEPNDAAMAAFFRDGIDRGALAVLIARLDGAPCGYACLEEIRRPATLLKRARESLLIRHLAVEPQARRRGVGRALLDAAIAEAKRRGLGEVDIDHWAFNEAAAALFASVGFKPRRIFLSRRS